MGLFSAISGKWLVRNVKVFEGDTVSAVTFYNTLVLTFMACTCCNYTIYDVYV